MAVMQTKDFGVAQNQAIFHFQGMRQLLQHFG
jgi:hypothetical protein